MISCEVLTRALRTASIAAFCLGLLFAQDPLSNDSVVKLVKAGMGEETILNMINTQPSYFSLSADDLISLKANGVLEKVISTMLLKKSGGAVQPAADPSSGPIHEIGVYYKKGDAWLDMTPEVVNFKTGGVLKSIATEGIMKGDVNGHIKGAQGKTSINTPVEILIYAPEGVAATEYQLLRLRKSGDAREFRTMTGGVFHQSGGASRDDVEFEAKKTAPRTFTLTLSNLKSGEYGILPPHPATARGPADVLERFTVFTWPNSE